MSKTSLLLLGGYIVLGLACITGPAETASDEEALVGCPECNDGDPCTIDRATMGATGVCTCHNTCETPALDPWGDGIAGALCTAEARKQSEVCSAAETERKKNFSPWQ